MAEPSSNLNTGSNLVVDQTKVARDGGSSSEAHPRYRRRMSVSRVSFFDSVLLVGPELSCKSMRCSILIPADWISSISNGSGILSDSVSGIRVLIAWQFAQWVTRYAMPMPCGSPFSCDRKPSRSLQVSRLA